MKPSPRAHAVTEFLAILVFALIVLGAAACSKEQTAEADLGALQALSLSFSAVPVGSSRTISVTVTNSGAEAATNLKVDEPNAPFTIESSTCGPGLASKASCEVKVAFAPTVVAEYQIEIGISFFTGVKHRGFFVVIEASSVMPADLVLSGVVDYGMVAIGNEVAQVMTVTNNGGAAATDLYFLGFTEPYHLVPGTCGVTLAAGASCTISVRFQPLDTIPGNQNVYLNYKSGAASETVTYGLMGLGQAPALLHLTGDFDFGDNVSGSSIARTYVLSNDGQWEASAITIDAGPNAPFSITANSCTAQLLKGDSCQIEVNFSPTALGAADSSLELSYENGVDTGLTISAAFIGKAI